MSDFFRDLVNEIKDEGTSIAGDGKGAAEFTGYVDTGCYMLNAVLSGSLYGGLPNNKITGIAGESSTGKTFIALGIVRNFLNANPTGGVAYFDTEAAVTTDMLIDRDIDPNRVIIAEPDTLQKFRHQALTMIDKYMAKPEKTRPPMLFVLDSLGMLSTSKEIADSTEGKDTKDMTRAQIVRAVFRVLTLKLARANIPFIVNNHVYAAVGCAVAGTTVRTENGFTEIQNVKVGDIVPTLVGPKPVTNVFEYDSDHYFEIEMENGEILKLTQEHKLMVQNGEWKRVEDLAPGDVVIST